MTTGPRWTALSHSKFGFNFLDPMLTLTVQNEKVALFQPSNTFKVSIFVQTIGRMGGTLYSGAF